MQTPAASPKVQLLRRMLEVVMWEWHAVKEERWEDLAGYGQKKQELIAEMSQHQWGERGDTVEDADVMILKGQIVDLEFQVKKMLDLRLEVTAKQLEEVKQRSAQWRHKMNPYRQSLAYRQ